MKYYLGNISKDACDALINECMQHTVTPFNGNRVLEPNHIHYEDFKEQRRLADESGYTQGNSVEFMHYKIDKHYDENIHEVINQAIDAEVLQSFVSEIRPGKCAPWHWDIPSLSEDPRVTKEYSQKDLIRGICFIDKPKPGQAFMVEDECFYMEQQGAIYRYPKLDSWHAGFNAGLSTKFLFTFTAIQKFK